MKSMKCEKNAKIKPGKRVLALFLVMTMLFLCFPAAVFAGGTEAADGGTSLTGGQTAQETPGSDQENTTPATNPDVPADNASTTEQTPDTTQPGNTSPTTDTPGTTPITSENTPDATQPGKAGETTPTADEEPMRAAAQAPVRDAAPKKVVIQYLYVDQEPIANDNMPDENTPDEEIPYPARPVTYEVESGETFTANIKFPSKAGYTTYYTNSSVPWNAVSGWNTSSLTQNDKLLLENREISSDVTYYVIYVPTSVTYTVNLVKQDADGNGYTFFDKISKTVTLGESVSVIDCSDKMPEGFHQVNYTAESGDAAIRPKADGSTTVEVKLDRNPHSLTFDCDGGSGMENVTDVRYGAVLTVSTPTKDGSIFKGWTVSSTTPAVTDATVTEALAKDANNGCVTVPDFDVTFTAQWVQETAAAADYTIIYYVQSAKEGEDDVYLEYTKEIKTDGVAGRGKTVTNTALPSGDSLRSYVTFNSAKSGGSSVTQTVKADGSTVFKRYFDRKRYTLTFDTKTEIDEISALLGVSLYQLSQPPILTNPITGQQYNYGTQSYITQEIKYGQNIRDIWPDSNWVSTKPILKGRLFGRSTTYYFNGIDVDGTTISNKPMYLTSDIADKADSAFKIKWVSSDTTYTLGYRFQPTNGSTVKSQYTSRNEYPTATIHDRDNINHINIDGFEYEGDNSTWLSSPSILYYKRNQYKIYYINTDLTASSVYYEAARVNLPAAPAKTGYTFEGWYSDPELTHKIENTAWIGMTMPAHDLYVYAKWRKNSVNPVTVTVYLDEDAIADGEPLTEITTDRGSAAAPDEAVSTRSHGSDIFTGWEYKADGVGTEFVFNSTVVNADTVVYGTWISEEEAQCAYTVKHVLYGTETELADETSGIVTYGTSKTFHAAEELTEKGYTPVQSSITKIITQSDEVIVFQYTDKQITVKFIPVVDGSQVDWKGNTVSQHVYSGGAHFGGTVDSEAVADDAFTFDGWFTDYACETPVPDALILDETYKLQLPSRLFTDSEAATFRFYAKFTSKGANLTIINNNGIADHGYLFRIDNGSDVTMYVSIVGIGSVTVSRLPIGETYTVTQMNSWSYDSYDNAIYRNVMISDVNGRYEAIFNNSAQSVNWLRKEVSHQY